MGVGSCPTLAKPKNINPMGVRSTALDTSLLLFPLTRSSPPSILHRLCPHLLVLIMYFIDPFHDFARIDREADR